MPFRISLFALGLLALTWFLPINAPLGGTTVANACAAGATSEGLLPNLPALAYGRPGALDDNANVNEVPAPGAVQLRVQVRFVGEGVPLRVYFGQTSTYDLGAGGGTTPAVAINPTAIQVYIENNSCGDLSDYQGNFTCRTLNGFGPAVTNTTSTNVVVFNAPAYSSVLCTIVLVNTPQYQCNDRPYNVIAGTDGIDFLTGTDGNDLIVGLGGNDFIDAKQGRDCVLGGDGNDYIELGGGKDIAWGENGNDTIRGGANDDLIIGGSGIDFIDGGNGDDSCAGEFVSACEGVPNG